MERLSNARDFLATAQGFLADRELTCGLKLGVTQLLIHEPQVCPSAWFAVIRCYGEIRGCALQTPPRNLVISELDRESAEALAEFLAQVQAQFPAVHGPAASASAFAEAWARRQCVRSRNELDLRLFSLKRVKFRPSVPGVMRLAKPRDASLVTHWFRAFHREAIPRDPVDPVGIARRALDAGRVFVWDHGGPVCLAAVGRELATSASIGPVYTPPERRGEGYATALVSALSQYVLDAGKRQACLFTDLANPISNHIYPRIGYEPISDFRDIAFE
ncbi:MAG: GNAT family N-acetyltransferase [Myxococcales bacterium]